MRSARARVPISRHNRVGQDVSENTVDVAGRAALRLLDHLCRAIEGIDLNTSQVGDYTLPQLYAADEAFVTGTMGGLAPVTSVDGRTIGDGAQGPVTKRLIELYADLTATTGTLVI
jgi:hypothetical protein